MTATRPAEASPLTPNLITSRVFEAVMQAWLDGRRGVLLQGGTSSSKTYSVLQFLNLVAATSVSPLVISIISESLPHLKLGAIRDFFKIIGTSPDTDPNWSKTEFIYTFKKTGSKIEFWGADNSGKASGPRRDIAFINEGNNVPWSIASAVEVRTSKFLIVDWNPTGEFWVHNYESGGQLVPGWITDKRFSFDKSTYLDARKAGVLPQSVIDSIESRRDKDMNWWNIYGLGETGNIEGLVYPRFEQVDALPTGAGGYGLDFGFSDDPAVLVKNVIIGDRLYSREIFYEWHLNNDDISRKMDLLGVKRQELILADAAEPKSIDELRIKGWNIIPTEKGPGSVEYGIQKVNQFYQFWTKDSVNCIKEQRNFRRIRKREPGTGREYLSQETTHQWSHGMDARRYFVAGFKGGLEGSPAGVRVEWF